MAVEQLVGRYDLQEQVTRGRGRTLWRGHDTVLERSVGVLVLDADHPHGDAVRQAAQRAARVEAPGLLRVVDADVVGGQVFVVTRWLTGMTLAERLVSGPLPPEEAASVVAAIARALVAAAEEGVHHLVLDPRDVLLTQYGAVAVGVGVRAALEGVEAGDDAEQVDAWRLGALLYAALTGRWPGHECAGLPAAPTVGGRVARPRQVRAGIPYALDDIAWRAVQPDAEEPLETPGAIADALDDVDDETHLHLPETPHARSRWPVVGVMAVLALLLAGVALVGWQFWQDAGREEPGNSQSPGASAPTGGESPTPSGPPTDAPSEPLEIASATAFDPLGDGVENDEEAALAIDGDSATAWQTLTYASRELGDLKPGVGLRLRLDEIQQVGGIELELEGRGTDLQVWAKEGRSPSDESGAQPANKPLAGYTKIGETTGAGDELTLSFEVFDIRTDEVIVWLTALPAGTDGYQGGIAEVRLIS